MKTYYSATSENLSIINTMLNLDAAIVEHYADLLFKGDFSRITYSSTERCFRERAKKFDGELNLPFMNIYRTNMLPQESYPTWYNKSMTVGGVFIPELGIKVRALPITVSYDANVFYGQRMEDAFVGMGRILQDNAYETRLKYAIPLEDSEFQLANIAVLEYNPQFDNLYADNDYFQVNKIRNIQLDFKFDTFLFLDADTHMELSITEKAILRLAATRNISTVDMETSDIYEIILQDEAPVVTPL